MRAIEFISMHPISHMLLEGGNAFDNVGTIHIDEIKPTMQALADKINMPEILNNALGSVGKVEYSGDIDIAVDLDRDKMKELSNLLRKLLGSKNVTGVAGNISISFPIVNYDNSKQGRPPRTGNVQIDFIPGSGDWMKTFYHSPGSESKAKGVHRNIMLTIIANHTDRKASKELDDFDRPAKSTHWSWGSKNGLVKVEKTSRKNKNTGKWVKKQDTKLISEPIKDVNEIVRVLFGGKAGPDALNSIETLVDATKQSFSKKKAETIFQKMAKFLNEPYNSHMKGNFEFPKEVEKYL